MEYVWFLAIVCVVVAAGGKVIEFSYNSLINKNYYTLIAPFDVAGSGVATGEPPGGAGGGDYPGDGGGDPVAAGSAEVPRNEGLVLANAVRARLYLITSQQEAVVSALTSTARRSAASADTIAFRDQIALQAGETDTPPMNLELFQVPKVQVQIAGIEVGGVFSWIYRTMAERSALKFSVTRAEKMAVVTGQLLRDGSSAMYEEVANSNEDIVAAVAYSLYREQLAATIPQMKLLDWKDLRQIHIVTTELAGAKGAKISPGQLPPGSPDASETFIQIIDKAPKWRELLLIGAELARQDQKFDLSEHYLRRALDLTDAKAERVQHKAIDDGIKRLKESVGTEFAVRLNLPEPNLEKIYEEALKNHKSLLQADKVVRRREPVVAIFGGVPFRDQLGYPFAVSPSKYLADRDVEAFVDTLALVVESISPKTKIIFAARPNSLGTQKSPDDRDLINQDIVKSLALLEKEPVLSVLIFPFTKSIGDPAVNAALAKLEAKGCLIIAPVSSRGSPLSVPSLKPTIALVSATDVAGHPAHFSWEYERDRVLWAPGTQIPALTATGEWVIGASSAYAAAAAAGVAANVLSSADRQMSPEELLDVLQKSSRQEDPRDDGVRVLDQRAALAMLPPAAKPADPPAAAETAGTGASASQ